MEMREANKRLQALMKAILDVWERSVEATNLFRADSEVKRIKECAPRRWRASSAWPSLNYLLFLGHKKWEVVQRVQRLLFPLFRWCLCSMTMAKQYQAVLGNTKMRVQKSVCQITGLWGYILSQKQFIPP